MMEFTNKYEIREESGIAILTIESYIIRGQESSVTVKKRNSYTIIIPIEFIDEVKKYKWWLDMTCLTPHRDEHKEVINKEIKENGYAITGLNNITPFVRICSSKRNKGKYCVSSKNELNCVDNDRDVSRTDFYDLAVKWFEKKIDEALEEENDIEDIFPITKIEHGHNDSHKKVVEKAKECRGRRVREND